MASFLLVVDADAERREKALTRAAGALAPFPGLVSRALQMPEACIAWTAGPSTPLSVESAAPVLAVTIGDALDSGGARLSADDLSRRWPSAREAVAAPALDGLHFAVCRTAGGEVIVGADLLGILPVYHWSGGGVCLVGSSPALFTAHPRFGERADPMGLAGLLLLGHALDGRTLLAGVRRLAPGHLLVARVGVLEERRQYQIPLGTAHADLTFAAQAECLREGLERAVARHVARPACGLLLSGGRDSRLLAGILVRQGRTVTAVTLGRKGDQELRFAKAVASHLGLRHRSLDIEASRFPELAERALHWEQLAPGFHYVDPWGLPDQLPPDVVSVVTGHVMDAAVGGSHIEWALARNGRGMAFEPFFERVTHYGFTPESLRRLLRPGPARDAVDAAVARVREIFAGYGPSPAHSAWCFDLHHRQRLYVGRALWPIAFGAWPALPAVDSELLSLCGNLSVASLAERRLEDRILVAHFPGLAALPLDRNSFNATPLSPRLRNQLAGYVRSQLRARFGRIWTARPGDENSLYFHRTFSINSDGWQQVRHAAEASRARLYDLFDRAALELALPPPGTALELADPMVDSNRAKLLVGLILWARHHEL